MSKLSIGQRPDETGVKDAVHVAVISVVAGVDMEPGTRCGVLNGVANTIHEATGIIDPFVEGMVNMGEIVLFLIDPKRVSGLRHEWSSDDFPELEDDYDEECRFC